MVLDLTNRLFARLGGGRRRGGGAGENGEERGDAGEAAEAVRFDLRPQRRGVGDEVGVGDWELRRRAKRGGGGGGVAMRCDPKRSETE